MGPGRPPLVALALLLLLLLRSPRPAAPTPACLLDCLPGTFLSCERSPEPLCRPCPQGTFSSTSGAHRTCTRCRQCEGKFIYKRKCSPTVDAECGCKEGKRCAGKDCSKCLDNCGVGQEPTDRGCQTCPSGKFNNQTNGLCRQWTKCPPKHKVMENGTTTTDQVCSQDSEITTTAPPPVIIPVHVQGKDLQNITIGIALTAAIVLCVMLILPFCVCFGMWDKKKISSICKKMNVTPQHSTQEEDACSCRFPEEEQGDCDDCSKSKLFKEFVGN